MRIRQIVTRLVADAVYCLKRRAIQRAAPRFLVFTGTVGKTTMRDAVGFALRRAGLHVRSNTAGYSNELGVVLTILGLETFHPLRLVDWIRLLCAKIPKNSQVLIELGADFYKDIPWFVKKFKPFAVFISGVASDAWSADLSAVATDRERLLSATDRSGFIIYNLDDHEASQLVTRSFTKARKISVSVNARVADVQVQSWSNHVATLPAEDWLESPDRLVINAFGRLATLEFDRPLFAPQLYGLFAGLAAARLLAPDYPADELFLDYPFSTDRLQCHRASSGALIIEDSYKATPMCTAWFLGMAKSVKAEKKIVIVTEMRPLTLNSERHLRDLAAELVFADQVYFLGPAEQAGFLTKFLPMLTHIVVDDYPRVAEELLALTTERDAIFFKGSFRYKLADLRKRLV